MVEDKSPILDEYLCGFLKATCDLVRIGLLRLYKEVVLKKYVGSLIKRGFIKFVPKVSGLELITNWRLITLLNVSCNIITKSMALWCWYILHDKYLGKKKKSFISGWYIFGNVLSIWENMEWARCLRMKTLFIKTNFEKSYWAKERHVFLVYDFGCSSPLIPFEVPWSFPT